jgi:L-alanine-DL-glutamate epimerase-like enolase superfamily enzyme
VGEHLGGPEMAAVVQPEAAHTGTPQWARKLPDHAFVFSADCMTGPMVTGRADIVATWL